MHLARGPVLLPFHTDTVPWRTFMPQGKESCRPVGTGFLQVEDPVP